MPLLSPPLDRPAGPFLFSRMQGRVHTAARRWALKAVEAGLVSVETLMALSEPCTDERTGSDG